MDKPKSKNLGHEMFPHTSPKKSIFFARRGTTHLLHPCRSMDNKHTARSTASVGGSAGQPAVAAMDTSTATPRRAPTVAAALALTVSAAPTGAPAAARKMTNPLRNQPERLQKVREREAEDGQLEAQTLLLSAVSQQQTWSCKVCTFQNPMGACFFLALSLLLLLLLLLAAAALPML